MLQRAVFVSLLALAGLIPLAAGVPQDETDMHQHEGSRLPHELSRTIAEALTVGEDEGHVHPDCDVSCNGEKYHTDGPPLHGGAEKRGSCWGNFNFKCNITTDEFVGEVFYKCDGAFTFVPVNESDGVHVHALLCEGAMFEISEMARTEAAPGLLQADPPTWCPPGIKCASAIMCLANSQVVTADTDGTTESYVHCEDVLGTGYGYKKDDDSDGGPQHGRKDPMHDEEVTAAEMFEQALTDGSPWGGWARPAGGPGAGGEAPPDMQPASIEQLQEEDDEYSIKWTCNDRTIHPWLSWWPCWGKTEYASKTHFGDNKSTVDIVCHGFSIPMRMSCKGLSTIHSSQDSKGGSLEVMQVTKGHKHFVNPSRKMHGWKVSMSFSKGFNTLHSRDAAADAEASEQVSEAMDAAIGGGLVEL